MQTRLTESLIMTVIGAASFGAVLFFIYDAGRGYMVDVREDLCMAGNICADEGRE